jgi:hypothetical protein
MKVLENDAERLVIVSREDLPQLENFLKQDYLLEEIIEYPSYKVATPKNDFFLKNKRATLTKNILLLKVKYIRGS